MKETTDKQQTGIQWNLKKQLDNLDFADDIALLSSNNQQMQDKTTRMMKSSRKLGRKPTVDKTEIIKINCISSRAIKISDRHLEENSSFVYLGSTVSVNGGTDEDIKVRINKARVVFKLLKKVLNSRVISCKTKLRIFNSNVKSVLLYGSETWRNTKSSNNKLQTFVNKCFRTILKTSWTDRISKSRGHSNTNQAKKMEM